MAINYSFGSAKNCAGVPSRKKTWAVPGGGSPKGPPCHRYTELGNMWRYRAEKAPDGGGSTRKSKNQEVFPPKVLSSDMP